MAGDREASSSSLPEGMYDAFLSFRGKDTRYRFTDHLYDKLEKIKLKVFRDEPDLEMGDQVDSTLMEAIRRSRMFIVVISENYVSSSWCLMELEEMLKYSNNGTKRRIFPIFYDVEPAEVRYQINDKSKKAMEDHERRVGVEKVKAWKLALSTLCRLSGQHIVENREYETKVMGEIADKVLAKNLEIKQLLSRFDSEFEAAESLLNLESQNTLGMLGIFKEGANIDITTFAFELYYKIKYGFQAASFLVDVSKMLCKNNANGLENLKKELLSDMDVEESTKQKLQNRRVLVVLEGVDSKEHLELLLGEEGILDWFGRDNGSRIIITTENKNLFQDSPVMNGAQLETYCIREGEFDGNRGSSTVMGENIVGLEKEFEEVIKQLKGEEGSPGNVVSIVGMGGLGKTTLARKVYYSNEARQLFPCRAWATISQRPRLIEVFRELLKCMKVPKSKYENSSEEELKEMVRECLDRKKSLIVLDDVWDTNNPWGALRVCFPKDNNGSMILVTTRNHRVANFVDSKNPHLTVSPMTEEESWKLFRNEVFHSAMCPPELEPIAKSIAESCNGLPLLIKTTAGTVAKRERSKEAWEKIKDLHPYWSIAEDKDGKQMMERLKLSYDDLYPKMKPCFLYLGAFPEDEEISLTDLICMWIAEDFIEKPRRRSIQEARAAIEAEDIGEEYLNELVDRNLVQVASRRCDGKGVKTVKIHDLIRELCILVSEKPDNNCDKAFSLSFPEDIETYACLVRPSAQSSTCSLFFHGNFERWSDYIPEECQVSNVLYLEGEKGDLTYIRNAEYLKKFKSVRFLNMGYLALPSLLFQLQSLQSFRVVTISGTKRIILHEGLNQPRHFRTYFTKYLTVGAEGVENKMKNVQTLSYVCADSQMGFLLDNGYFANVRALGLEISEDEVQLLEENLKSLNRLSKLRKLKFRVDNDTRVSFGKIKFPSNLSKISLNYLTSLKDEDMKTLGQIPTLQILKLNWLDCTEKILHCGDAKSFPLLEVFILKYVRVKDVKLEDGAMPKLRRVVFDKCPGLKLNCLPKRMHCLGSNLHFVDGGDDHDHVPCLGLILGLILVFMAGPKPALFFGACFGLGLILIFFIYFRAMG